MMKIKTTAILVIITFCSIISFGQNTIAEISKDIPKNEYAILEVRLNMEDEFRTLEGRESQGLSRVALYTGKNKTKEVLSKGFTGYNDVVTYINEMKDAGWVLEKTYSLNGTSLMITHYVFRKNKKG